MPCNYKDYPSNWKAIRAEIMARAENRCECTGVCRFKHEGGRCGVEHGATRTKLVDSEEDGLVDIPVMTKIVLTIAHLCHKTKCARRAHLLCLCARCHLRLDAPLHAKHAAETRDRKRGQLRLQGI